MNNSQIIKEWQRRAEYHQRTANDYAEESHQWDGDVSDAYSSVSEAHNELARAFRKKAGIPEVEG